MGGTFVFQNLLHGLGRGGYLVSCKSIALLEPGRMAGMTNELRLTEWTASGTWYMGNAGVQRTYMAAILLCFASLCFYKRG